MGSGEHPALMMDSANCSPVQVSGTYLLPNTPNYSYLFSWWQLYVSIVETKTEGGGIIHLQPGWDAESGCLPALCYPAGMEGLGTQLTVFAPALRFPRDKLQQQLPEVHTSRPEHRCSIQASRGVEWHITTSLMAVWLQVLAEITSQRSGQVRHQPHFISADTDPGGTESTPCHNSERKSSYMTLRCWNEARDFTAFKIRSHKPCDEHCSTRGCTLQAAARAFISVLPWCISMIWAFGKNVLDEINPESFMKLAWTGES